MSKLEVKNDSVSERYRLWKLTRFSCGARDRVDSRSERTEESLTLFIEIRILQDFDPNIGSNEVLPPVSVRANC